MSVTEQCRIPDENRNYYINRWRRLFFSLLILFEIDKSEEIQ